MRETRPRGGGFSRDGNGVGFADAAGTQFAKSPISNAFTIFMIASQISVRRWRHACNILRRQASEFAGYFYGS